MSGLLAPVEVTPFCAAAPFACPTTNPESNAKGRTNRRKVFMGFNLPSPSPYVLVNRDTGTLMNDTKYIGFDVHEATISAAVRDCTGRLR